MEGLFEQTSHHVGLTARGLSAGSRDVVKTQQLDVDTVYKHEQSPETLSLILKSALSSPVVHTDESDEKWLSYVEAFKVLSERLIERLDRRSIVETPAYSHLDALKRCYQKNKSHWNSLAKWYGPQSIWMKIGWVLLITAMGAGFGAIGQMALIFAIVGCVWAIGLGYLLHNHHQSSVAHEALFDAEVAAFEDSVKGTVMHLQSLEADYSKVLCALLYLLRQQADNLVAFKEKLSLLESSKQKFAQQIGQLQTAKSGLSSHADALGETVESLKVIAKQTIDVLSIDASAYHHMDHASLNSIETMAQLTATIHSVEQQVQACCVQYENKQTQQKETRVAFFDQWASESTHYAHALSQGEQRLNAVTSHNKLCTLSRVN